MAAGAVRRALLLGLAFAPPTPPAPSRAQDLAEIRGAPPLLRWTPSRAWGIAYLWGVVVALAVVAAALVANVVAPFAEGGLPRTVLTLGLLLVGWALAMAVPVLARVPALRPAAATCVPAIPLAVFLLLAAIWDVGPQERLARLGLATFLVLVFAFLLAPAWNLVLGRRDAGLAGISAAGIAIGGAILALAVAGLEITERITESAWRGALALVFASLLLWAAQPLKPATRVFAWTAFAQYAAMQAIDPWVAGDLGKRLNIAALALVLGLLALTIQFIPTRARTART